MKIIKFPLHALRIDSFYILDSVRLKQEPINEDMSYLGMQTKAKFTNMVSNHLRFHSLIGCSRYCTREKPYTECISTGSPVHSYPI